jgi:hypothetical protein
LVNLFFALPKYGHDLLKYRQLITDSGLFKEQRRRVVLYAFCSLLCSFFRTLFFVCCARHLQFAWLAAFVYSPQKMSLIMTFFAISRRHQRHRVDGAADRNARQPRRCCLCSALRSTRRTWVRAAVNISQPFHLKNCVFFWFADGNLKATQKRRTTRAVCAFFFSVLSSV